MIRFNTLFLLLLFSTISLCQNPVFVVPDYDENEKVVDHSLAGTTNLETGEFLTTLAHLNYNLEKTIGKPFNLTGFPTELANQKPSKILPSRSLKKNEFSIVKNLDRTNIKKIFREIKKPSHVLSYMDKNNDQLLAIQMGKKWMIIKGDYFKLSNISGYYFTWVKFRDKSFLQLVCERDKNVRTIGGNKDSLKWKAGKTLALLDVENRYFVLDFIFLNYDYRYISTEKIVKEVTNSNSNKKEKIFINRERSNQQSATNNFIFEGKYNALRIKRGVCQNKIVITSKVDKKKSKSNQQGIKLSSMTIVTTPSEKEPKLDKITITITPPDRPCHELLMEGKYILNETGTNFEFFK